MTVLQCIWDPKSRYQETNTVTGDLTEHSPVEDPYCPVTVYWQLQFDVLHYSLVSKFCIKFGNSA